MKVCQECYRRGHKAMVPTEHLQSAYSDDFCSWCGINVGDGGTALDAGIPKSPVDYSWVVYVVVALIPVFLFFFFLGMARLTGNGYWWFATVIWGIILFYMAREAIGRL